jgi:alanine racemase
MYRMDEFCLDHAKFSNKFCSDHAKFSWGRTAAFIDLSAIAANTRNITARLGGKPLMAVVKADGYGHGGVMTAKAAEAAGADYFGVATAEEGLELAGSGVKKPILALGFVERGLLDEAVRAGLEFTVFDGGTARILSEAAERAGRAVRVHFKIDTGMGRIGFAPGADSVAEIAGIARLPYLSVAGAFTHLADSDGDPEFTERQIALFADFRRSAHSAGVRLTLCHFANSAAVVRGYAADFPGYMARAGIILYGLSPSPALDAAGLIPALSWLSRLSFVKALPAGSAVSYGRTYRLARDTLVGTVPVGYADGYARANGSRARVIINGAYAPVIGRVCMDQFMVDLADIPNPNIGDPVTLIGSDGSLSVSADDLAANQDTINYEVVCGISKRVKRIYLN